MQKIYYLIVGACVYPLACFASQRVNFINKYDVPVRITQKYKNDSKNEQENEHVYSVSPNGTLELILVHKSPGNVYGQINVNYPLRFSWSARLPIILQEGAAHDVLTKSTKEMKGVRRVTLGPDVSCVKGFCIPSIKVVKKS